MKTRLLFLLLCVSLFQGCQTITPTQQRVIDNAMGVLADAAVRRVAAEIERHPSK